MIGVRAAESVARRSRKVFEVSRIRPKRWYLSPILDWTTQDVWDYIQCQNLPYCSLYDEGRVRLGCIMCPMQGTKGMLRDAKRYPEYYDEYMKAIEEGFTPQRGESAYGTTPQEVMYWWIYGNHPDTETRQTNLTTYGGELS